ncbi:acyltransferase [Pseudomonas sp. NyZ704]|nr:acyltransferase [Pseudomonas sp. NyZ704]
MDYAKALGIILVVYGHVARGLYNAEIDLPQRFYELTDSIIYTFHMPLFFVLAGLFFSQSLRKQGGSRLVLSKVDTIVYPFILWSILQGSIEAVLSSYTNGDVTFAQVFSLLWSPRAQFWFLYALFLAFVLAALLYSLLSAKITLPIFLLAAAAYVFQMSLPGTAMVQFLANNFVYFVLGILFNQYLSIRPFGHAGMLLGMTALFVLAQYGFHISLGLQYENKGFASLALALVSIAWVFSLCAWAARAPSKLIIFIGTSSMAIYLMHILAGSGVRILLGRVLGIDDFLVHLVVGCLVGLFAPLAALVMINWLKIPFVFAAPLSALLIRPSASGKRVNGVQTAVLRQTGEQTPDQLIQDAREALTGVAPKEDGKPDPSAEIRAPD